jgi:Fe-S-cluster containining protein
LKKRPNCAPVLKRLDEAEGLVREALAKILEEIHSPASLPAVWPQVASSPAFREVTLRWDRWTSEERHQGWEKISRVLERAAYASRPYCLRCGSCCRKGSPSLYRNDLPLFRRGAPTRLDLVTLRRGERVYSNEADRFLCLPEEQVKIREKPGSRECLFFQPEGPGCGIYNHRPLQCRVLECWNPEGYRVLKRNKLLSRKDLLDPQDPLLPVMKSHEERCSVLRLQELLMKTAEQTNPDDEGLLDIILYDRHTRTYLGEKIGLNRLHLDFLLGRPVADVVSGLGFQVQCEPGNRFVIRSINNQ